MDLLSQGHGSKGTAYRLHLSRHTVETHRTNIMRKLDVHDAAHMVRRCIELGYIQLQ